MTLLARRVALAAAGLALAGTALLTGGTARASTDRQIDTTPVDCTSAGRLARAGLIDDAITAYAAAAKAGLACGTGQGAVDAKRAHGDAATKAAEAHKLEVAGDADGALDAYLEARSINQQDADALAGVKRLGGVAEVAAATTTTTTTPPFNGALELQRRGREDDARTQAIEAIKKGAILAHPDGSSCESTTTTQATTTTTEGQVIAAPTGDPCDLEPLVHDNGQEGFKGWVNDMVQWFEDYWKWVAAGLIVLALVLLRSFRRTWRYMPKFVRVPGRMFIEVKDETGLESKVVPALATSIRQGLARAQAQAGANPRFVAAADADVSLPDLKELPDQAKWFVGLLTWWSKQHSVTLTVSVMPPGPNGLSCRAALVLPGGRIVSRGKDNGAERLLTFVAPRPPKKDGSPAPVGSQDLRVLSQLVTAWTLFQYGWQFRLSSASSSIGTRYPAAQEAYLDGLERLHTDPSTADEYFELASAIDESLWAKEPSRRKKRTGGFSETLINSGYCKTAIGDYQGAENAFTAALQKTRFGEDPPTRSGVVPEEAKWLQLEHPDPADDDPLGSLKSLDAEESQELAVGIRAVYGLAFGAMNDITEHLLDRTLSPDALEEASARVLRIQRIVDAVRAGKAGPNRAAEVIALMMADQVDLMSTALSDLRHKRETAEQQGHFSLIPLGIGSKPPCPAPATPTANPFEDVTDDVRTAIERAQRMDTDGEVNYSLACIFAKDLRFSALNDTPASTWPPTCEPASVDPTGDDGKARLERVALYLDRAISLDPRYGGWSTDPDLEPIAKALEGPLAALAKAAGPTKDDDDEDDPGDDDPSDEGDDDASDDEGDDAGA